MRRWKRPVRGLVDGMSMAWRLAEWETRVRRALDRLGLEQVGLPDCPFASYTEVPKHLVRQALDSFSPWFGEMYGARPEKIRLQEAPVLERWWYYLQPLDRKGKLSPALWVRRDAFPRARAPKWLAEPQTIRLFLMDPTLDSAPEEGVWWCVGAMLEWNKWWYWDIGRARRLLARLSGSDLERELDRGSRIAKGDEQSHTFWDGTWVMRPIQYGPYKERQGRFPFPEYEAVPFYRVEDQKTAFEAIMQSYLCLSLLDDFTDKQFATQGIVAEARDRLGLPRTESRGRPRGRPRDLVASVGDMVRNQGLPKYQVAKRLKMPRSTVYDYLRDFDLTGGESQN